MLPEFISLDNSYAYIEKHAEVEKNDPLIISLVSESSSDNTHALVIKQPDNEIVHSILLNSTDTKKIDKLLDTLHQTITNKEVTTIHHTSETPSVVNAREIAAILTKWDEYAYANGGYREEEIIKKEVEDRKSPKPYTRAYIYAVEHLKNNSREKEHTMMAKTMMNIQQLKDDVFTILSEKPSWDNLVKAITYVYDHPVDKDMLPENMTKKFFISLVNQPQENVPEEVMFYQSVLTNKQLIFKMIEHIVDERLDQRPYTIETAPKYFVDGVLVEETRREIAYLSNQTIAKAYTVIQDFINNISDITGDENMIKEMTITMFKDNDYQTVLGWIDKLGIQTFDIEGLKSALGVGDVFEYIKSFMDSVQTVYVESGMLVKDAERIRSTHSIVYNMIRYCN